MPTVRYVAEHVRSLAVLALFLLPIVACGTGVDTSFDPCSPLRVVPGADTQEQEAAALQSALDAWSDVLPTQIEIAADAGDTPALHIYFDDDSFYRAIYFDKRAEIWVNRTKLAEDDLPLAIAHELGHAFGLLHTAPEERGSVMNVGNLTIAPTFEDAQAVGEIWDECLPD